MSDVLRTPMIQRLVARVEEAYLVVTRTLPGIAASLERIAIALEGQDPPENPYDRVVLGLLRREPGIRWSTGAIANQVPDCDKEALGLSLRDLEIRGVINYDNGWFVFQEATRAEEP